MDQTLGVIGHVVQPLPDCWVVCVNVLLAEPLLKDVCVDVREHHWSRLPRHLGEVLPGAVDHLRQLHLLGERVCWGKFKIDTQNNE